MTAFTLLMALQTRSARLSRDGDRLVVDVPKGLLTAADREALLEHKATLLSVVDFDPELAPLVCWFREAHVGDCLPTEAFVLAPWIQIVDPARFYAALERDIASGPRGPRVRFGGLADSLRRLRALVEVRANQPADGADSEPCTVANR